MVVVVIAVLVATVVDVVHVGCFPTKWLVRRYCIKPDQHPPTNEHVYTKLNKYLYLVLFVCIVSRPEVSCGQYF